MVLSIRTKITDFSTSNFYLSSSSRTRTETRTILFFSELEPELKILFSELELLQDISSTQSKYLVLKIVFSSDSIRHSIKMVFTSYKSWGI